jgi:predicted DsbA family dithiol-disulfide isomerase
LTALAARPDLVEALFAAQFLDGRHVGDRAVLAAIGGRMRHGRRRCGATCDSGEDAEAVRGDAEEARRLGISGVPFFILAGRYGVAGAQPPEVLLEALRQSLAAA